MESCAEDAAPVPQQPKGSQFSLTGLMLFITWLGLCLGALAAGSLLAGVGALIVFPSLLRTIALARQYRAEGHPMNTPSQIANFVASMGLMVACGFATIWTVNLAGWAIFGIVHTLRLPEELFGLFVVIMPFSTYTFYVWLSWSFRLEVKARLHELPPESQVAQERGQKENC